MKLIDADALRDSLPIEQTGVRLLLDAAPTVCCAECRNWPHYSICKKDIHGQGADDAFGCAYFERRTP